MSSQLIVWLVHDSAATSTQMRGHAEVTRKCNSEVELRYYYYGITKFLGWWYMGAV